MSQPQHRGLKSFYNEKENKIKKESNVIETPVMFHYSYSWGRGLCLLMIQNILTFLLFRDTGISMHNTLNRL